MRVKQLIVAFIIALVFMLPLSLSASADVTTPFGNTYTEAQRAQFCAAVRPGSASWVRYDCGNVP